jgi:arylsulfatase A-like enzyme
MSHAGFSGAALMCSPTRLRAARSSICCAILCILGFADRATAADARPNILFITVDDQSPLDLRPYNPDTRLETPNIDRLAREGITIDGAYHMGAFIGAVCTPSRHMMMCGRTLWHLPIAPGALETGKCPPNLEQQTIPAVFNRAGYATMRTCKPGNSYQAANKLFQVLHQADKRGGTAETGSAWHAEQVLAYLDERKSKNDTRPFVIDYGFSHPHDTRDGIPELLAKYGAVNHTDKDSPPPANPQSPPLPVNYLPAHPFFYGQPGLRDETTVSGVWERRDERTIRNEVGRYFACSENIDIQIGRVLKKLEESGELENTYIVYTSDHGIAIGRHGLQGKQNLYQHCWRVPFIVRGPGIRPCSRAEGNIYLLDLLATICDLTGVQPPETNEGISFKPVLLGQKNTTRDVTYCCYNGGTKPGMRCVKKGDWKLIKYDLMDGTIRETQLFNLKENPNELVAQHHAPDVVALTRHQPAANETNLAGDPRYADKLKEMEELLLAEMRRTDDPWRLWNQPTDGLTPPAGPPPRPAGNPRKNAKRAAAAN